METATTVNTSRGIGLEMMSLAERLFPICRSLTGDGVRQSLDILRELIPLKIHEVASGTQVFDWIVPEEWNVRDAFILDPQGRRIVDFKASNLHLMGYSTPFEGELSLQELNQHLHSLPERPNAFPYVTSYYSRQWGFCLSHRQRQALKEGRYYVKVDTTLQPGSLTFADLLIPGETDQEILLSSYLCHPSMANNELSGPLVAAFVARELLARKRRGRFSYRLVLAPETIGTIVYLSRHLEWLQKHVRGGYVLTCIGDRGDFSYLHTRHADQLVDRLTLHVLRHFTNGFHAYSWLERGSDERQYNWPGVDVPIGTLMRTKFGTYPEYHTSDDDLRMLSAETLEQSVRLTLRCLDAFEENRTYRCTTLCEPQMGRRGLYPTLSTRGSGLNARRLLDILAYSDGTEDLLAMAERLNRPIWDLVPIVRQLETAGLLREIS